MSPALTGRFFTTKSPGKSPLSLKLLFLRNLAKRVWSNCLSFWSSWRSFPLLGGVGGPLVQKWALFFFLGKLFRALGGWSGSLNIPQQEMKQRLVLSKCRDEVYTAFYTSQSDLPLGSFVCAHTFKSGKIMKGLRSRL